MVGALDWVLIGIYMLGMVVIGIYFKTSGSLSDYAVADKKLGLSVMIATLVATAVGGGVMTGSVGNAYQYGLLEVPKIVIIFAINVFLAMFVAKNMRNIGGFTAPEMLGRVYGKKCQALGGLFCVMFMIGTGPAMQSIALGNCFHLMLGVDMKVGMCIGMVIILAYTMTSGMWGVAMTDYVQFIFLTVGILIVGVSVLHGTGGWEGIISKVPRSHFNVDTSDAVRLLCTTAFPVLIDGNRYARFYSAKDGDTARAATLISAIPQALIQVLVMIIGLAAVGVLPVGTKKDAVFATLLLRHLPVGIKGICIAALMAAIMSTADSYMLTGATNISVDIYKTCVNPEADDKQIVFVTKFSVLLVGLLGLGFALFRPDVIFVWTMSATAYVGGCLVPMIYGIFSRKGKKSYTAALAAMICGGAFALVCDWYHIVVFKLPAIVYGILLSAVVMGVMTPFMKDAKIVNVRGD